MDDYISREAASDLLEMAFIDDWEPEYAQDRLSEIPAADVAPVKRGKWVFKHHRMMGKTPCCSECGKFEPMIRNFCPNCGADMREPNLDTTKGDNHD